jgi:hypothetical protein
MLQQFTRAFTHTMEADDAFIELQNCKMGERSPDEYIAEFNELSRKAHWDHDNRGTVELFKQGLPVIIHRHILGRDTIPQTMPQWQEQLRKEVERSRLIQASTGAWCGGKGNISTRENLFRGILDPRTQPKGNFGCPRPRDPDAMDVDRVQVTGLSTEERARLYEERKCFHCKKPGHIARIATLANNKEEELLKDRTHWVDRVTKAIHRREKRPRQGLGPRHDRLKSRKW